MYAGEIVEEAPPTRSTARPRHPYTVGLMQSFPPLPGPIVRMTRDPGLAARPRGAAGRLPLPPALPALPAREHALYARQTTERPRLREVAPGPPRRLPPGGAEA